MKVKIATQYLDESDLLHKYNSLPATKQVPILYEALGIMQQFNGRSKSYCILRAMGYDNYMGERNTWFKIS